MQAASGSKDQPLANTIGDLSPDSAKNRVGQQQEEAWKLILLQKLQ